MPVESSWGKPGVLHLGLEYYLAVPEPRIRSLGLNNTQTECRESQQGLTKVRISIISMPHRAFLP